jgi:hypothetical protein
LVLSSRRSVRPGAARRFSEDPNGDVVGVAAELVALTATVEASRPVPLHAQLDNLQKWIDMLGRRTEHERFGGRTTFGRTC